MQTVFSTTAQKPNQSVWLAFGTLQVGVIDDIHSSVSGFQRVMSPIHCFKVFYHAAGGRWVDISSTTESSSKAGIPGRVRLVKSKIEHPDQDPFTFNVAIQKVHSEDAEFSGTFTGHDGVSMVWNGTFSAFANAPELVKKKIDPELEELVYKITPFERTSGSDGKQTSVEQARAWSGLIFHEVSDSIPTV